MRVYKSGLVLVTLQLGPCTSGGVSPRRSGFKHGRLNFHDVEMRRHGQILDTLRTALEPGDPVLQSLVEQSASLAKRPLESFGRFVAVVGSVFWVPVVSRIVAASFARVIVVVVVVVVLLLLLLLLLLLAQGHCGSSPGLQKGSASACWVQSGRYPNPKSVSVEDPGPHRSVRPEPP